MAGIVALIVIVGGILVAILWVPVSEFLKMRRAQSEEAKQPHRARLRQWFRMGGLILIAMAILGQSSVSALPDTGLPLGTYDLATAAIGVAMLLVSFVTLRDPDE